MLDPARAEDALDFPNIDDDLHILWTSNEFCWPDARRQTFYLSDQKHPLGGFALFTPFAEKAATFASEEAAQDFLDNMSRLRPNPYHDVRISTVAEMKVLRGYVACRECEDNVPSF